MDYRLNITAEAEYLHVRVTGTNTPEAVAGYLQEVHQECVRRRCFRVLIEEHLEGPRLSAFPVFKIAAEGSARSSDIIEALAYVDAHATGDLMQFAQNVARNRGMHVAVFASVAEARAWLQRQLADPGRRARTPEGTTPPAT
ncbi:MAG: hypothetical protein JO341_09520 [Gammaproteobacteria bacterium]|nr:hypothetical protein [Gammaproteobacteria bacterium]MBV9621247.1 hypothetical protein [Gammaproteobacteria bacterium]